MDRKKLKDIIRERLKVQLFMEENNIPQDNKDNKKDKNSPEEEQPDDQILDPDSVPGETTYQTPPKDGELNYDKGAEIPDEPAPTGTPPEKNDQPLVPPDFPAKDSEKVYLPSPEIPDQPVDNSDKGGDIVPAKDVDIAPPPEPKPDYVNNPDANVPANAPELGKTITHREAGNLIKNSKGQIFTVIYIKRTNGETRYMNARLGVKRYLKGGVLPFDPNEKGLIPVFDLDPKVRDYRMIPINNIKILKIGGQLYNVE